MTGCARVRDLLAELALGIAGGDERAAVLAHVGTCDACSLALEETVRVADALLLTGPEAEPPVGFESRVVARLRSGRRRRWWTLLAAATAAATLGAGIGAALAGRGPAPGIRSARLRTAGAAAVGEVYLARGSTPWVFMTVDRTDGTLLTCQLVLADGATIEVGSFRVQDGRGSWGRALAVDPARVVGVRVLDDAGRVVASARID